MEGGNDFALSCGFCDEPIKPVAVELFRDPEPHKIMMPFGKYRGTIIGTMNRLEDINYFKWLKKSDAWGILGEGARAAIDTQITLFDKKMAMGVNIFENNLPEPEVVKDKLSVFKKKNDFDDLAI